jgi:hypothetical protein
MIFKKKIKLTKSYEEYEIYKNSAEYKRISYDKAMRTFKDLQCSKKNLYDRIYCLDFIIDTVKRDLELDIQSDVIYDFNSEELVTTDGAYWYYNGKQEPVCDYRIAVIFELTREKNKLKMSL